MEVIKNLTPSLGLYLILLVPFRDDLELKFDSLKITEFIRDA